MVMQPFVNQTPAVTLSRDTQGPRADRTFPTGQAPPIPGGPAQSFLVGTLEARMAIAERMQHLEGLCGSREIRGPIFSLLPPWSTMWETPPVATVLHAFWCSHPLQDAAATPPSMGWGH